MRHSIRTRVLMASLASAAMLLSSGAAAQANWGPPAQTDSHCHCGAYNMELYPPVRFQECVVVSPGSRGSNVQSVMPVDNRGGGAIRRDLHRGSRRMDHRRLW
jgi:hypothetical protein